MCAWHMGEGRVQTWFCQMAGDESCVCMACGGGYDANPILSNGWKSIPYVCSACGGRIMFQTCLPVSNGWKSILCVYMVCGGGYDPNLIVSNGWQSSLWEGYSPILIFFVKWLELNRMCVHSIWRRVWSKSRPDCVKLLEINPMCVHGM